MSTKEMTGQELHAFVRRELRSGRRRQDVFVEACHRNGHPEVDIAKAEELFRNYDSQGSNRSFMDHEYRWEFMAIHDEHQFASTGIAAWSSEVEGKNFQSWVYGPKFLNNRYLYFAKTSKSSRYAEDGEKTTPILVLYDLLHEDQKDIPITGVELPMFPGLSLTFVDRSHFLLTMEYPENGNHYWLIYLLSVDFEAGTCNCLDTKRFPNAYYKLSLESTKHQTFLIHKHEHGAGVSNRHTFQLGRINGDKLEIDERSMRMNCLPQEDNIANEEPKFILNYVDNKFIAIVSHQSPLSDRFYEFQIDEQEGKLHSKVLFDFNCTGGNYISCFFNYTYINGDVYYTPKRFRHQGLCTFIRLNMETRQPEPLEGKYAFEVVDQIYPDKNGDLLVCTVGNNATDHEVHRLKMSHKVEKLLDLAFKVVKRHFLSDKESQLCKETVEKLPVKLRPFYLNFM